MNLEQLKDLWKAVESESYLGWDFTYINERTREEALPWDYAEIVKAHLKAEMKLLDMDTGGGEFLLALGHPYENTSVTEAWAPNIKLCQERLSPLGIDVREVKNEENLPFEDETFDIVINRHGSYEPIEVCRVLKKGGLFITQQVGSENNRLFAERLNKEKTNYLDPFSLETEIPKFSNHNFKIQFMKESISETKYFETGAVVCYAVRIPWCFPDFSVGNNLDALMEIEREIGANGFVKDIQHRFVISARKV